MATKTQSKGGKQTGQKDSQSRSIFNWDNANAGVLVGAAVAGAAAGFAANYGRKLFVQFTSGAAGDWVGGLTAEHRLVQGIFEKIEATDDSQKMIRLHLLMKLKYALTKHALEEENVIYPALREANESQPAEHLNSEHAEMKMHLYELEKLPNDSAEWMSHLRDLRMIVENHMREEEEQVFPRLRERLSEEQNAQLTTMMHKEGFKYA